MAEKPATLMSLSAAIEAFVHDGDVVALEGFGHLVPFAAGHEIIRQKRRKLTLVRMAPDLLFDQMIGAGCAEKLVFSWAGNPGVGSLHRFRDAVENDHPHAIALEEYSHAALANAWVAGASNVPFAVLRGYLGGDLKAQGDHVRAVTCPFTGEVLAAVPAQRPDVGIIHAQKADRRGNVLLWGVLGVQKEVVLASRHAIVTVEEIVDDLEAPPNACVLPSWTVHAIVHAPGGAQPSYTLGYDTRDNDFYVRWDAISRDRETFAKWLEENVLRS